jgi:hypothetical protein
VAVWINGDQSMRWVKRSAVIVGLVLVCAAALGFYYFLPRHEVVLVTGVEVKRMDADGVINAENPADGPTRDVYFINTEEPDSKAVTVYRNEDTGWSFPWYFKFDSADIQAKAQGYSRDAQQLAVLRLAFSDFLDVSQHHRHQAHHEQDRSLPGVQHDLLYRARPGAGGCRVIHQASAQASSERHGAPVV